MQEPQTQQFSVCKNCGTEIRYRGAVLTCSACGSTFISYDMNRNLSARSIHESIATQKIIMGPVGTGKSTQAFMEFLFLCLASEVPISGIVIREAYRQLMDSTLLTCMYWLGPLGKFKENKSILEIRLPSATGAILTHKLFMRACRKPEEASKFLSTEFSFLWYEECAPAFTSTRMMGQGIAEGTYEVGMLRSGRQYQQGAPYHEVVLTFNPPSTRHWLYKRFLSKTKEELLDLDTAIFRQTKTDNEQNLRPGYYEELLKLLSDDLARRFVLGEVTASFSGVPVYTEFLERVNTLAGLEVIHDLPLNLAFDFGNTPCCLICQRTPFGQIRVYREIQLFNSGIEQLLDHLDSTLKSDYPGNTSWRCWGDPAGDKGTEVNATVTPFTVMAARGYECLPGAVSFFARKHAVKGILRRMCGGYPALIIDPEGCPMLVEALLGGYRYPTSLDGRVGDKPLKNEWSHLANALEYEITGEFDVVESINETGLSRKIVPYNPLTDKKLFRDASSWLEKKGRRTKWMCR